MSTAEHTRHDGNSASLGLYQKLIGPAEAVGTGLLWLACCVPVLTAGSSTVALFRITHRRVVGAPVSPLRAFVKELRTAPLARCGATLVVLLAAVGIVVTGGLGVGLGRSSAGIAMVLVAGVGAVCLLGMLSTFLAIAGIFPDRGCWDVLRMAIAVAMSRVSTSLTMGMLIVAVVVAGALFPPVLLVALPVWATLTVRMERSALTRICRSASKWREESDGRDVGEYYRPPDLCPARAERS